ncbi:IclR family transcriptional regulator C-terminal domain-containing protein [Sphingomonas sp.]|uniref:IclR family transcriptional regulator n=1 Tax=Sphingomonas sp. TaxID=28214 RepID=UPI0025CEE385|nr:IclR family transcriptional regulator C-terminal domain-containing protein [Sphingomonas sp.]
MKTPDKVLSILRLFSVERPEWTVEAAATELNLAQATAYEYFRSLLNAELLAARGQGRYAIGPAVFELDHLVRQSDPLLIYGEPAMERLVEHAPVNVMTLLCRFYRMKVMCVAQRGIGFPGISVSYERGRLMPLLRGAASKVILANVERRKARRFYDDNCEEVAANGLGKSWEAFRSELRQIREQPAFVTFGELDHGLVGISAPIFGPDAAIQGSVSYVVEARHYQDGSLGSRQLKDQIARAGSALSQHLGFRSTKA